MHVLINVLHLAVLNSWVLFFCYVVQCAVLHGSLFGYGCFCELYGDSAGNTIKENSSACLIQMH